MIVHNNPTCLLSATEKRLSDCLSLCLETKDNYFSPNSFRLSLNNCIQTMRNVTWVLQKAKSRLSNFDSWYAEWQEKMQKDNVMMWLVKARNVIVKEGDLATSSKLHIAVVETWFASPYLELDISPFIHTEDFLRILAKNKPDNLDLKVGLLRAERRWIDEQLKECELLEALSHVYVTLSELLLDAHKKLSYQGSLLKCSWYIEQNPTKGQQPDCMKAQDWDRTVWLDLNTGQTLQPVALPAERIDDEEIKRHYPDLLQDVNLKKYKTANLSGLEEEAKFLFEAAKNILKTDGFHLPTAILGYPDGHRDIHGLQMLDRVEKHLVIRSLAADIERTGAVSVILIDEVWVSNTEYYRLTPTGIESPTRREALQLVAANAEGKTYTKRIFFTRDDEGKINMGAESSTSHNIVNILAPIKEVWNRRHIAE